MPQPTPIAVVSCVIAVHLALPCAVEWPQTMLTLFQARIDIRTMIAAAIGTVHFSNAWIQ